MRLGVLRMRNLRLAAATCAGALFVSAATPSARPSRLVYDPAVFLADPCGGSSFEGGNCSALSRGSRITESASGAVLGADAEPRLPLDLATLLDMGPTVLGGRPAGAQGMP